MNKLKAGATLQKVEDTPKELQIVKLANVQGNKVEAIRNLNNVVGSSLDNLDRLYETREKVKAFDPKNPEVKIGIEVQDANGNKFVTSNPLLVAETLRVIESEVEKVIADKEAELIEMAV
jgi:hypothetical protein